VRKLFRHVSECGEQQIPLRHPGMDARTIGIVGVFVFVLWLPTLTLAAVFLLRRFRLQERLNAIEQERDPSFDPKISAANTRRAGIVLLTAGVGIVVVDVIVTVVSGERRVLGFLALATVPLAVGFGLLLEHRLQLRDIRQRGHEV
jgi:hypothetical protein